MRSICAGVCVKKLNARLNIDREGVNMSPVGNSLTYQTDRLI